MTTMNGQSLDPLQLDYDLCTYFHGLQTATYLTTNHPPPRYPAHQPAGIALPVHGSLNDPGQLLPLLVKIILYQDRS